MNIFLVHRGVDVVGLDGASLLAFEERRGGKKALGDMLSPPSTWHVLSQIASHGNIYGMKPGRQVIPMMHMHIYPSRRAIITSYVRTEKGEKAQPPRMKLGRSGDRRRVVRLSSLDVPRWIMADEDLRRREAERGGGAPDADTDEDAP
ncbi:hypothetical protein E4U14_003846, partial [Claviceps sp. LM454 group G7]